MSSEQLNVFHVLLSEQLSKCVPVICCVCRRSGPRVDGLLELGLELLWIPILLFVMSSEQLNVFHVLLSEQLSKCCVCLITAVEMCSGDLLCLSPIRSACSDAEKTAFSNSCGYQFCFL